MSLIKEMEMLKQWACTQERNDMCTFERPKEQNSYWRKRQSEPILEEYDFDSIVDLKGKLLELWEDENGYEVIAMPLAIATFKAYGRDESEEAELPVYVYAL